MGLPDLIEIVPLKGSVRAEITVPGSKSITNRALILAALADGDTTLKGALWSEDTQIMVECLHKLGFTVDVAPDPDEFCNRTISVKGLGGKIPNTGTAEKPLELFVGNAGTAARFLSAFVCLGKGVYRIYGIPRMNERPKAALFQALRELGYRVESPNDKLPVIIHGSGPRPGKCTVSIEESSQFASALLLCAKVGGWEMKVVGENDEESPYVAMTSKLIKAFGDFRLNNPPVAKRWDPWQMEIPEMTTSFQIEPDASSGSYFLAAERFTQPPETMEFSEQFGVKVPTQMRNDISIAHWPHSGWQIDEQFTEIVIFGKSSSAVARLGDKAKSLHPADLQAIKDDFKHPRISRRTDLGDSIMTLIAVVSLAKSVSLWQLAETITFTDLGRLRLQETERVVALRTELTKCGAKVIEEGDTLTVYPSELHGAEIETYNDHRMAMCFAILGLKVPGIKLRNPACVKKTFPNFFQKVASPPPQGLGATILDARTGKKLSHEDLFAD